MLKIDNSVHRILLINSPAFDTRLPWAAWHQPVGLLKIGAWLHAKKKDVRLIDCLQLTSGKRLPKQKQRKITIENSQIDIWRIGTAPQDVISRILLWQKDGWFPDAIFVSTGMTFWWEATRELIQSIKKHFTLPVYLGGAYPTYYYDHALENSCADIVIRGSLSEATDVQSDLSLFGNVLPNFAAVNLVTADSKHFLDDICQKYQLGIRTFVLYDDYIGEDQCEILEEELEGISALSLPGLRFIAPGNLSPRCITKRNAQLLKTLDFKHIYFHDDITHSPSRINYISALSDYQQAIQCLHEAGFKSRTDELGAAVLIGLPREDLSELTQRVIKLASITGSVHLVPYQFTPGTKEGKSYETWIAQRDGHHDITALNGRFFPLARLAGKSFDEYLELTRLVALLNSKFHSQTFDFLGDTITANMVRKGLSEGLWDPSRTLGESNEPIELNVMNNDNKR